ncbi:MAG: glycosyltransferase family 1 protein [Patescibacteria group bacterium]
MIIGLDANEANVLRRVGSNEYAFQVLWQLYRQGTDHQWVIYLSHEPQTDLPQPKPNWQYRVLKPGFFWTQWRLPLDLLFHSPRPAIFLTLGHYAPRFSLVPTMVCIMDLAFLKFPATFRQSDLWQLTSWTKYSVKNARHIFAISQATKKDLVKYYGLEPDKITVAYPGVDQLIVKEKSPIAGPYLLYVGTLQPRKNLDALIEAFSSITHPGCQLCQLIIAGKTGWLYQPKAVKNVQYLGYVSQEKLGSLIKNSLGLVLPSLYEGFGIPVVQAMSLGVPVLVSRNSSLTEIVGDSGLYIEPPFDAPAIRSGLEKLLSLAPPQKQTLTASALLRSHHFSWPAAGKTILTTINGKIEANVSATNT